VGLPAAQGLYDPAYEHDGCGMGFVAHLRGARSNDVMRNALLLLGNLEHRSAVGSDAATSDGSGILFQLPHAFLRAACAKTHIALPEAGQYGVGMFFLPRDRMARRAVEHTVEDIARAHGCRPLGWRNVPVNERYIGKAARRARPYIRQFFLSPEGLELDPHEGSAFERILYVIRRNIEKAARRFSESAGERAYVASLSSRTIVYKGLVRPSLMGSFYPDLVDPDVATGLALVHSRFSTNTFPSWSRAHPYRFICHNGEINTLSGNLRWMGVAEEQMSSPRLPNIQELFPLIDAGQSDSASLDNALELLVQAGRSLPHAMMMLIPESWEGDATMAPERRAFFEFHASLMEPWDGPAAVAFTDGRQIGAILDRNGLRPGRYVVTDDDFVILASEAGALDVPIENVRAKGRLRPGNMLLVNTTQGRIVDGEELKNELAGLHPYRRWIAEQRIPLKERGAALPPEAQARSAQALTRRHVTFGYTSEDLHILLAPMATTGEEPIGSMGNDTPLAALSERPQLLFGYFRQLFAQVTNPAIDPIREQLVMSLGMNLGPRRNLLDATPEHTRQIRLEQPVLTASTYAALTEPRLRPAILETLFRAAGGAAALESAIESLCAVAAAAARSGAELLILSDDGMDARWAAIPSLLAVSAVHHHLIRERLRSSVSIVVHTGEARDVTQIALLISYGASAVYPSLAFETITDLVRREDVPHSDLEHAHAAYIKAVNKGLLKIMSKMGISTLQSYCGAQTFEAVGLSRELVQRHFAGTASRLGGVGGGLDVIADETCRRHARAYDLPTSSLRLDVGGNYHYRVQGESHQWNPRTIATLQMATRSARYDTFKEFSRAADDESRGGGGGGGGGGSTIRGLLDFVDREPVRLSEVEPASEIVRRFVSGAMSFGSLSREAHETMAIAMNRLGGRSNTGEGGEDPARFGTERNSAIKQVASARFGVTTEYLVNATELQIKIAQGAKPGEGGQLPGHKVDETIARTRYATPGVTLISPPPHHDIYSIEDLAQLIYDLKSVNPRAAISVKLVAEAGVGTVAVGVAKARADLITISGDSGGTGASPLSSIKHAGVPWELGLAEAQQTLLLNGLRGRVRLQTDGQFKTGRDVVIAALLGAEEFGFATAPLIVEGCVMMRKCHLNTCPVGIATQDPVLRAKFAGRPEHVVNYFFFVAEEVRELMARLGFCAMDDMIGRSDVLRQSTREHHPKARALDLSALLHIPKPASVTNSDDRARRMVRAQDHGLSTALDHALLTLAKPALERGERVTAALPIRNVHRAVGAMLSGEIARRFGHAGLADDTITLRFGGSAGQSFGAFAARGLTLELHGEANDYVGKGLSGGRIIVRPPKGAKFLPDETVIVGNTALYGATGGEALFGGVAGERFAVRNSGATAVVEGVGDHGCEYMTGGVVVVLGRTGRNFAAGMSGGLAFVLDASSDFATRCNRALVELAPVTETSDAALLKRLIERHAKFTGSARARHVLAHWDDALREFVRVVPTEYLKAMRIAPEQPALQEGARLG
jgi:glutamate synthase domain-containing protein 2/glutamate synthase domain-containing protein 1/glutamate synthase domain-containing protein 3